MAVDFASKQRERAGEGFGLRNIKLRFSRKLIFAVGLLVCFSCHPDLCPELRDVFSHDDDRADRLVNHLKRYVELTPLEILALALLTCGESDQTATRVFGAYDTFLERLHREDVRVHLENLKSNEARADEVFSGMRTSSHEFQAGLSAFFFDNQILRPLTLKYGVF
jgi:hypothetical protein